MDDSRPAIYVNRFHVALDQAVTTLSFGTQGEGGDHIHVKVAMTTANAVELMKLIERSVAESQQKTAKAAN